MKKYEVSIRECRDFVGYACDTCRKEYQCDAYTVSTGYESRFDMCEDQHYCSEQCLIFKYMEMYSDEEKYKKFRDSLSEQDWVVWDHEEKKSSSEG